MPGLSTLGSPSRPLSPPAFYPRRQGIHANGVRPTNEQHTTVTSSWSIVYDHVSEPILRHQRSTTLPRIPPSQLHTAPTSTFGRNRSLSVTSRTAQLELDFIIVGGGIAGMACAYALGVSGHRVRVLEKYPGLGQRAGGIRVPPNLTKILLEWGLEEKLDRATQKCRGSTFHSLETGEPIGYLEWREDVLQETGADFLLMHHEDLHRMLYDLAVSAGVSVIFNAGVCAVGVNEDTERVEVTRNNGQVLYADVVVGADGYQSLVREIVTDKMDDGVDSGMSVYTATIPAERMKADPELSRLPDRPEWPMWMGDSRSVLGYPIRGGKEFTVHVFWPDAALPAGRRYAEESWDIACPSHILKVESEPRIQRLVAMAPYYLRAKYVRRGAVENWVDVSGRIVLVGEAAHPMLPCTIHNTSLAIEDAAVLGSLFSRLRSWDQIPQLLEAFQDLRQDRCQAVHLSELNNGALVWLPPGPQRDARDAGMRLSMQKGAEHWDEGMLREQWDTISEVFGYNAREAAEDWWVNWGTLRESSKSMSVYEPLDLRYVVTEVIA